MYKQIKSPKVILEYLKNHTFNDIPPVLWDRYLWFYEPVVDMLSEPVSGRSFDNIDLYADVVRNEVKGVVYIRKDNERHIAFLDAVSFDGLAGMVGGILGKYGNSISMTVKKESMAHFLSSSLGIKYNMGLMKLYTTQFSMKPTYNVKEVCMGDGPLFVTREFPGGWPELDLILEKGTRYFIICENGVVVSMCGICQLTAFRTELIALWTHEQYRRRGYAKAVCAAALNEAFKTSSVVTWTAKMENEGSISAAISLGFKPFMKEYVFEINR